MPPLVFRDTFVMTPESFNQQNYPYAEHTIKPKMIFRFDNIHLTGTNPLR